MIPELLFFIMGLLTPLSLSAFLLNPGPKKQNPERNAFTLIELMIVIVILGLLATIVMPRILNRPEDARVAKAKVEIKSIESALGLFKTDTGRFPTTSEGLDVLADNPGDIKGYNPDGYLKSVPRDPWDNDYIYLSPGVHDKDYDLKSLGRDGEPGGSGYDADIESWNLDADF